MCDLVYLAENAVLTVPLEAKPSSNSEAEQDVKEFETEVKEQLAVHARTLLGFERRLQKLEHAQSVRTEQESADEALRIASCQLCFAFTSFLSRIKPRGAGKMAPLQQLFQSPALGSWSLMAMVIMILIFVIILVLMLMLLLERMMLPLLLLMTVMIVVMVTTVTVTVAVVVVVVIVVVVALVLVLVLVLVLAVCADHSWLRQLQPDPETDKYQPNKRSRQVKSGHYVRVAPTPLPEPKLIIYSAAMAEALGIPEEDCSTKEFAAFFSGQQQISGGKLESWCTPYALSIMGQPMVRNCPFGNGNGYGDGRAISVGEVLVKGQRWEMQLKGGGQTPFCRGADGRAVLRSSIREFLASEAMYHLGVDTTRALSLVVSDGGEMAERPWYSSQNRDSDPDMMIHEPCAITTRVAPSFLRVGHVDLFARRASHSSATPAQIKEHELIVEHALFREYPNCLPGSPLPARAAAMLRQAAKRFSVLIAGWLRVGFCQGNFNADNCLVGGRTMDYGPFGWIERYDPMFAKWVGSGNHFAFRNQPEAGLANFMTLAIAMKPLLGKDAPSILQEIAEAAQEEMNSTVSAMWRAKLGFPSVSGDAAKVADSLWADVQAAMRFAVDYTIFFRQLADALEVTEEGAAGSDLVPGSLVRINGLKSAEELNGSLATCGEFVTSSGRWAVVTTDGDKALKPENLEFISSGEALFATVSRAFYDAPKPDLRVQWLVWLRRLRSALTAEGGTAAAAQRIRATNPKYIPREWMLVQAYDAAAKGDYSLTHELHRLFLKPYDEQPEFHDKYFCCTPPCYRGKGGVEIMPEAFHQVVLKLTAAQHKSSFRAQQRHLVLGEQAPSAGAFFQTSDFHSGLKSVADELRREIQERCDATEQRFRDFCRRHMSPENQATGHSEPAAKDDAAKAKAPDDVSQRHSPRPSEADTRAALPVSAKSAEAAFCGSPRTPIGVQDPAALRSTTPRSGRSPHSFHFPSPCHINMSAVAARDVQDA
ncbi:selO, partial [Symbiodinium microadriaticum]